MFFVTTRPEMLNTAAGDLASIGSALTAQKAAAVSAQAAAIHDQFVAMLGSSAASYAATEGANALAAR